ncbi:MAG: chromosomal replication initiator protein DnaA [Chlorobi bacterium]|nr:chromosomal replication initiator protein DnaA [Chlorobiota bacterium]
MTMKDVNSVWNECLRIIKDNVGREEFDAWFKPIKPVELIKDKHLVLRVPSHFYYEWLEANYVGLLKKTLRRVLGSGATLEYQVPVDSKNKKDMHIPSNRPEHFDPSISSMMELIKNPYAIPGLNNRLIKANNLNPSLTFDTFVEGSCNRLARSAGLRIAEKPGQTSFNPFVVYSDVGLGKTHLVHAIGNAILSKHPNKLVIYTTGEIFTSQFVQMLKRNAIDDFMQFYYNADVLIIDDVHHLSGKEKTQEVLFHIFNFLHNGKKQIILTTDQPPIKLKGFTERLLSRFKWGLSAELTTPDYETRKKILQIKLKQEGVALPGEIVEFIAKNVPGSIRDLEGVLISTLAHATLVGNNITLDLVRQIIGTHVEKSDLPLSIEQIAAAVTQKTGVTLEEMRSKSRKRNIVIARQLVMFLARELTSLPMKQIGTFLNRSDHTAVIYACSQIGEKQRTDQHLKKLIEGIKSALQSVN